MKQLQGFLQSIGAENTFSEEELIRINNKRFIATAELRSEISRRDRLVYAGMFLGKTKNIWEPSTILLRLIAAQPYVHKVWVDDAAAWLFVCGRDVFTEHIQRNTPDLVEGVNYLIMLGDDCLGYARLEKFQDKLILKNLIDIGDFLRREKWREE